jgi:general secretion pathway protein A
MPAGEPMPEGPAPTTTVEPAVVEPSPILIKMMGARRHPLNEVMAIHALFNIWGAAYQPMEGAVCRQAEAQGLRCHVAEGSLDDLKRFNRPAVLKFSNSSGESFYATITQLDDQMATLILEDEVEKLPVAELVSAWTGNYTLLWRVPPDFNGELGLGARGPAVEWLRLHLAKAEGEEVDPHAGDLFDSALLQKVKEFQSTHGLRPDGIAGLKTMIQLLPLSDEPPLLVEKKKDS